MLAEFGHLALAAALALAGLQALAAFAGARVKNVELMALGRACAQAHGLSVALSFVCLLGVFAASDFTVMNVAENSHSAKPLIYKLTGAWGNHEGSMLLWVLILALYGGSLATARLNLPAATQATAVGVQGLLSFGATAFVLALSNPFLRLDPPPFDGAGLNPLLQDAGLIIHPPMLYMGYVGFSVVFSLTIAGLAAGRIDSDWARAVRPYVLFAWAFLSLGIGLGAWWAYRELGWGGYWFWDPVENASLLPWLVGAALSHSVIVLAKRNTLARWCALLGVLAFGMSVLGTFLVRSGALTSVHAFAVDPKRGIAILIYLALTLGAGLTLYAAKASRLPAGAGQGAFSRDGFIKLNNLLMSVSAALVLVGTVYPLVIEALDLRTISVGAPYFNATTTPVLVAALIAMGFGPFSPWGREAGWPLVKASAVLLILAGAAGLAALAFAPTAVVGALGVAAAVWLALSTARYLAQRARATGGLTLESLGLVLAHGGVALAALGLAVSGLYSRETIAAIEPGGAIELNGVTYTLETIDPVTGPNYQGVRATVTLARDGQTPFATLYPERRAYAGVSSMITTEAALKPALWGDHYVTLADLNEGQTQARGPAWALRAYDRPLVGLIWAGVVLVFWGALLASYTAARAARALADRQTSAPQPQAAE